MSIVIYRDLVAEIGPQAPSAPVPTITRILRKVARDFCKRAECYEYDHDAITLIPGILDYEFDAPDETEVSKVKKMQYNGLPIKPGSDELLDQWNSRWRTDPGLPRYYMKRIGNIVTIAPAVSTVEALAITLKVALRPTRSSTGLEEAIVDEFYDQLIDGVLGQLLTMRGTEWYQPDLGSAHSMQYESGILDAKGRVNQDDTPKVRVTPYGGL